MIDCFSPEFQFIIKGNFELLPEYQATYKELLQSGSIPDKSGNLGLLNTGFCNIGNYNSGSFNIGNNNSGNSNLGNQHAGNNFIGDETRLNSGLTKPSETNSAETSTTLTYGTIITSNAEPEPLTSKGDRRLPGEIILIVSVILIFILLFIILLIFLSSKKGKKSKVNSEPTYTDQFSLKFSNEDIRNSILAIDFLDTTESTVKNIDKLFIESGSTSFSGETIKDKLLFGF
jgi:hypothetical protein